MKLLDREITPELARQMWQQGIVIAHSMEEFEEQGAKFKVDKYDEIPGKYAAGTLDRILSIWKGDSTSRYVQWSVLQGISVLDLGAGADCEGGRLGGVWKPNFARLCAINGAKVVAIDLYPQYGLDQTLFEWAAADLTEVVFKSGGLGNLPVTQGKTFDLIHSNWFIGEPPAPGLNDAVARFGKRRADFELALFLQAGMLLKKGGIMRLDMRDNYNRELFFTKNRFGAIHLF